MKYVKRLSINHNDPDYAISQRAFAPKGFVAYFVKSKKWYHCSHIENGSQCLINIAVERWQKLNEIEKNTVLNYIHEYPILEKFFPRELSILENDQENKEEINLSEIEKQLFILIGKKNISFNCSTSQYFIDLIKILIKIGQLTPTTSIDKLFKPISRQTLTKKFISSANVIFDEAIKKLLPFKYVRVAIDAGKIRKTPYLNVIISNCFSNECPIVLKTIENFGGTGADYEKAIKEILIDIQKYNLTATGFVGDNLRVQWSAFSSALEDHRYLINISCGCHSLNLGINDARSNYEEFEYHCSNIECFVHIFSSKIIVSKLHLSCPDIYAQLGGLICVMCAYGF